MNLHSALNIALFPPLFFFSALYYTDVVSTIAVLMFYWYFLFAQKRQLSTPAQFLPTICLGLASLLFRQTNIFWVAIFPAGLVLINELDRGHPVVKDSMHRRAEGFGDSMLSIARTSFKMEVVYDLPVRDAWLEGAAFSPVPFHIALIHIADYVKTVVSIASCTAKVATKSERIINTIKVLSPFLTLIGLFASFVVWNGGVVLGDKSNHVATLHLPQLLYIWPYFTFFSWPLLYPYLATIPVWFAAKLPVVTSLENLLIFKRRQLLPRPWITLAFIVFAALVVHFNTIVHPFTLADNRHYNFYVFRLLMRPSWVKYAVTPIYIVCGWACIQALGARSTTESRDIAEAGADNSVPKSANKQEKDALFVPDGDVSVNTSFVLVWLATSALQLVTAPLVEPRYFILPWIFWRMHVPLRMTSEKSDNTASTFAKTKLSTLDHRLVLETVWSLCVSAVTGYIFLYWGFSWAQEPGKIQRFMW